MEIKTEEGETLDLGNTNADIYVKLEQAPIDYKYALARTVGVKEYVS